MEQQRHNPSDDRRVIPVEATPVSSVSSKKLPRVVAKTVNICINCVQGAGRAVAEPLKRRHERHYHPRFPHGRKHLVADIAFVATILALVGANAWLLFGQPSFISSKVRLAWDAPQVVRFGEDFIATLSYTYDGDEPLDTATVALQLPAWVQLITVDGAGHYDSATQTMRLDRSIAPGASGTLSLHAVATASDGTVGTIRGTFHGGGATHSERTVADLPISVHGFAVRFSLDVPDVIPANGGAQLTIRYHSDVAVPFDGMHFIPVVDTPLTLLDHERDDAFTLIQNAGGSIVMNIQTHDPGAGQVGVALFRDRTGGARDALGDIFFSIEVQELPVVFVLGAQGDGPNRIALGDALEIGAGYYSKFNAPLKTSLATLFQVLVEGPLVPSSRMSSPGATVRGGVLVWPYRDIPIVGGSVGFTFTLRAPTEVDVSNFPESTAFGYTMTPMLVLRTSFDGTPQAWVRGTPFELPVTGAMQLTSYARYFTPEGDQIGRGPLPPRVGETTKYWITWDLRSMMQDAEHIVVRASLPDDVAWTGRIAATAGDRVTFDSQTRLITWELAELERSTGTAFPSATASFEVALTPRIEAAGRPALLLQETRVEASDASGAIITATSGAISTDLSLDERVRGRGVIRSE